LDTSVIRKIDERLKWAHTVLNGEFIYDKHGNNYDNSSDDTNVKRNVKNVHNLISSCDSLSYRISNKISFFHNASIGLFIAFSIIQSYLYRNGS
jgi:hypothetical protein